jgi:hypothetical protein
MNWRWEWLIPAERALRNMPWRDAARVDAAVQRFVATGEGAVLQLPTDLTVTVRLRVPPYGVRMNLDREAGTIYVVAVYRLPK